MSSGSPRKFSRNGTTYNVVADADINQTPTKEIEAIRHSGGNSAKVTEVAGQAEAIKLLLTLEQWKTLDESAEVSQPQSIEYQDGTTVTSPGFISMGNWTSAETVCEITAYPDSEWDVFGA